MRRSANHKQGFLICLTGIDGSGKSTLARVLKSRMEEHGIESNYIWCGWRRFDSFLLRPFASIVRRLLFHRDAGDVGYGMSMKVEQNRFLSPIYGYFILFDYFLSMFLKVRVPLIRSQSVVCDRYIYDVMTDLILHHNKTGNLFLNLFPKPDLTFLIDLPAEVAFHRKEDVPTLDYLIKKRQLYLDIVPNRVEKDRLVVVDGSEDVGKVHELIWQRVANILEGSNKYSEVSKGT